MLLEMTADEFDRIYDVCLDVMDMDDRAMVVYVPGPRGVFMVQATLDNNELAKAYSHDIRHRADVSVRAVLAARHLVGL